MKKPQDELLGAHYEGHCIIEWRSGNDQPTLYRRKLHLQVKPDRPVDPEAVKAHGITDEMLEDKLDFAAVA